MIAVLSNWPSGHDYNNWEYVSADWVKEVPIIPFVHFLPKMGAEEEYY